MGTTATIDERTNEPAHAPLLADYRRHLETARGLSPATVRNYLADLAPFIEYLDWQGVPLGTNASGLRMFITQAGESNVSGEYRRLIRDYVSWLVEDRPVKSGRRAGGKGHERASVVRTLVALRSFARFLLDRKYLPDSPLWQPRSTLMRRFTPRAMRRLPDILSTSDAVRVVEAPSATNPTNPNRRASALRDRALLELLYGSGLRVSEVTEINRGDVSFGSKTARVWGKGSKARMVPLTKPTINAISHYERDGRPVLVGSATGEALFLNHRGGRLTARSVQAMVQRYAAQVNVRAGVHPHTLRHSFATHLLDGGADLRIVQELLGHSTPSATQVYTHISQNEARKVYLSSHPLANRERKEVNNAADSTS